MGMAVFQQNFIYKNRKLACRLQFADPYVTVVKLYRLEWELLWFGSQAGEVSRKRRRDEVERKVVQKSHICWKQSVGLPVRKKVTLLYEWPKSGWTKLKAETTHFFIRTTLASWNMAHTSLSQKSFKKSWFRKTCLTPVWSKENKLRIYTKILKEGRKKGMKKGKYSPEKCSMR